MSWILLVAQKIVKYVYWALKSLSNYSVEQTCIKKSITKFGFMKRNKLSQSGKHYAASIVAYQFNKTVLFYMCNEYFRYFDIYGLLFNAQTTP